MTIIKIEKIPLYLKHKFQEKKKQRDFFLSKIIIKRSTGRYILLIVKDVQTRKVDFNYF